MNKIVFELTVEATDAGSMSDQDEVENIVNCVLDALGYPETVNVTAAVLRREKESP